MVELNADDFINFKIELDLLCRGDIDVHNRWNVLEQIKDSEVYKNVELFSAAGGVKVLCSVVTSTSPVTDRLLYLGHKEEVPFVKEPLGSIPPLGSLRVGAMSIIAEMTKIPSYRRAIQRMGILHKLCDIFKQRMGYLLKYEVDEEMLSVDPPRDQTLLLIDRILFCLSYLAIGSSLHATQLIAAIGAELVLISSAVNNTVTCDSISRLLDYCLLYEPSEDVMRGFLKFLPGDKLHALRPKCSTTEGRDCFDRLMKSLDKYIHLIDKSQPPKKIPENKAKYVKLVKCGFCGVSRLKMPVCGACHSASYCSIPCQTKHWLTHQIACGKG